MLGDNVEERTCWTGSSRAPFSDEPGRFFNPEVLMQSYEGKFWTKIVAWSGFGVALIGVCLPWISMPGAAINSHYFGTPVLAKAGQFASIALMASRP